MSQKKTPAKRQAVGMQNYGTIDPEFSRRVMKCNLEVSLMREDKPKTPEEMKETILKYFEICANYQLPPTVEGLGLATHYYRNSLLEIEAGEYSRQYTDIVKWAKNYIKNYDASLVMAGMIPASVYSFRAKNFYRYERCSRSNASTKDRFDTRKCRRDIKRNTRRTLKCGKWNFNFKKAKKQV